MIGHGANEIASGHFAEYGLPEDHLRQYRKVDEDARKIDAGVLRMESAREGDVHRLTLLGEFDLAGAQAYEAEIARIEAGGATQVVIDMSALEFMDSTGLRLLLETDMRSREDSGRVRYVRPKGEVARLLELTRVDERLDFID
jgi:anti-sigma B factor antagonist